MPTGRLLRFAEGRGSDVRALLQGGAATWHDPLTRLLVGVGVAHPVRRDLPGLDPDTITLVVPFGGGDVEGFRARLSSGPGGLRTVVVDDRGVGPPLDLPRHVEVVVHARNRGPAAARNTGWRAAETPFVAFADADVVAPPGWATDVGRHFADPELGLVAPRVRATGGTSVRHRYEEVRCPLDMGPVGGLVRHGTQRPFVPSTAWVVRRSALEAVGGFNEGMRVGEDVDLAWRLERSGWRVRYEPDVTVGHEPRADVRSWLTQRFGYGRSSADLWREHGDWLSHLDAASPSALPWAVGLGVHPVAGIAAAGAVAWWQSGNMPVARGAGLRFSATAIWRQGVRIGEYVRRIAALPLMAASLTSRAARAALAASATTYVSDWIEERPRLDPVTYGLLRIADDLAYGAGAWAGAVASRDLGSLAVSLRGMRRPGSPQTLGQTGRQHDDRQVRASGGEVREDGRVHHVHAVETRDPAVRPDDGHRI